MSDNIIARSINAGQSPELATRNTNVVRQTSVNYSTMGTDAIRGALQDMYREKARERAANKKEATLAESFKGQLTATARSQLPEDATEAAKRAFDTTSFIHKTQPAFQALVESFDDENFLDSPAEERNEMLSEAVDDIMLQAQEAGLAGNAAVMEYLNTQVNNTRASMDAAIANYAQEVLPARTITNLFEVQRESVQDPSGTLDEDITTWKNLLNGADSIAKERGMSAATRDKHLYAETARMLDSGDLSVYQAVQQHDLWNRLSTDQKAVLERGARSLQAKQRKNMLDSMATNFKRVGAQAIASGDVAALNEQLEQIQQLPPSELEVILPSIRKTHADVLETIETIEKGDAWMAGYPTDPLSNEQKDKYAQYKLREYKLKSPEGTTTQQAAQQVAVDMVKSGVIPSSLGRYFNLDNPVFQEGRLDVKTTTSLQGLENLKAQGLTPRQIEGLVGTSTQELFMHYKSHRDKNLDMNAAMAAALDTYNAAKEAPADEKFEKAAKLVTNRTFFGTLLDMGKMVTVDFPILGPYLTETGGDILQNLEVSGRAALLGLPEAEDGRDARALFQGMERRRRFENIIDADGRTETGHEVLYSDPGFLEGLFSNASQEANANTNGMALRNLLADVAAQYPNLREEQQLELAKDIVANDSIIANGSLITDRRASNALVEVAGSRDAASKYTTEALQVAAMVSALDPASQDEVMSSMYDHYVDGVLIDPSTEEGLAILANAPEDSIQSVMSMERVQNFVNNPFTVNGVKYPALRENLSKAAGWWDSGNGLFGLFEKAPITRARYLPESDSFFIEVMDRGGDPLTTDKDIFYASGPGTALDTESVNMESEIALPRGSHINNNIPMQFFKDYSKAAKISSFR